MARRFIRRSSGGFRRSPGRLTEWFALPFGTDAVTLAANSVAQFASLDALGLAARPFTITRVVGSLYVSSDQNAAVENPFGAWGMCVVSEEADAIGVTALPDPTVNPNSDLWFAYQSFAAEGAASTNVGQPPAISRFDFRAQRKVADGSDISIMIANASAADGMKFILNFRFLVKLS